MLCVLIICVSSLTMASLLNYRNDLHHFPDYRAAGTEASAVHGARSVRAWGRPSGQLFIFAIEATHRTDADPEQSSGK